VRKIISGPNVCICDECVGVCNEIIAGDQGRAPAGPRSRPEFTHVGTFTCPKCRTTFALQCETADEA
jgi:ATP-dependent Clp protease ATP-binding subunit ClpX